MQSSANRIQRKLVHADEYDLVYDKKHYCYLQRPSVCKDIKRRMNHRVRRAGKQMIRDDS